MIARVNPMPVPDSPRERVIELIARYFAAVDDKRLDLAVVEAIFAPHGKIVRPHGAELVGLEAITEGQSQSFARFRATQHVISDHIVDFGADREQSSAEELGVGPHTSRAAEPSSPARARVRANVVATHLWAAGQGDPLALENHFTAGGVLTVELLRLDGDWRISSLSNRVVWRSGSGFAQMLATGQR